MDSNIQKQDEKLKLNIIKATAVRQATIEVLSENRDEIIRRAKAKLVALGISAEDSDLGPQLS